VLTASHSAPVVGGIVQVGEYHRERWFRRIRRHKMAATPITTFSVQLITGDRSGAGTDGDVYIGIAGREFYIDSSRSADDDFERGSDRTYVFGAGSNVRFHNENDPRSPYQIFVEDIDVVPAYIRFVPQDRTDNWNLEEVTVIVNNGDAKLQALGALSSPAGSPQDNLWLGTHYGLYCSLWTVSILGMDQSPRARAR